MSILSTSSAPVACLTRTREVEWRVHLGRVLIVGIALAASACDTTKPAIEKEPTTEDEMIDPVGHWTLDGGLAEDVSLIGNHGRVERGMSRPGVVGSALALSGYPSHVQIGHLDAYESDTLSLSFWMNVTTDRIPDSPGGEPDLQGIIWKAIDTGFDRSFSISVSGTPPFDIYNKVGTGGPQLRTAFASAIIYPGTWHHVASVSTPSAMLLYVDGELVGQVVLERAPLSNRAPIVIGKASLSSRSQRYFNGLVDDVRLYTEELSPEQIKELALSEDE